MLYLKYPILVEGKYDKIKLSSFISSPIITSDGFGIFNNTEKIVMLKQLCVEKKLIILSDSDRAGAFIRAKLKGYLKNIEIINVYIPQIKGKEKRKTSPSKDGFLGVEGIDKELLYKLLKPYSTDSLPSPAETVTKAMFYSDGYSGGENSREKREKLALSYGLPANMTANALLEAINLLGGKEEYAKRIGE